MAKSTAALSKSDVDDCGPSRLFAPTRSIRIRTQIPGSASRAIRDDGRIVVKYAHGARVIDVDDNIYLDFANLDTACLGHTPEVITTAVQRASEQVISVNPAMAVTTDAEKLRAALCALLPSDRYRETSAVLFNTLGAARSAIQSAGNAGDFEKYHAQFPRLGRSGKIFQFMHDPAARPAYILIGAELSAGLSFAAVLGDSDQMKKVQSYAFTSHADTVSCAAALAGLDYLLEHDLPTRATQIGDIMREQIALWEQDSNLGVERVELQPNGQGCQLGLRFRTVDHARKIQQRALQNGLLLHYEYDQEYTDVAIIELWPALMIPEEQLYEGLDVLDSVLREVAAESAS